MITFEECWPLAGALVLTKDTESKIHALLAVTEAEKQKDAAGLGALAFAFHEGDRSMLDLAPNDWAIRVVSEGLKRPSPFFTWAESQCSSEYQSSIVEAARTYLAVATWGWDKTCILAGAFLAATSTSVPLCAFGPTSERAFPYWTAIDKHTPRGKEALHQVGAEFNLSYRHLIWAGFYFESAVVNSLAASRWWNAERDWRLRRAGLNAASATDIWNRVRARLADRLEADAAELAQALEGVGTRPPARQPDLF